MGPASSWSVRIANKTVILLDSAMDDDISA